MKYYAPNTFRNLELYLFIYNTFICLFYSKNVVLEIKNLTKNILK